LPCSAFRAPTARERAPGGCSTGSWFRSSCSARSRRRTSIATSSSLSSRRSSARGWSSRSGSRTPGSCRRILAAGWPNTGFIGYPLSQLLFGAHGVALAVLYDRLSWLVPGTSASTAVARVFGRRHAGGRRRNVVTAALANPPVVAMAVAIAARVAGIHVEGAIDARAGLAAAVGPAGFFLGSSLPLERVAHDAPELGRAAGALAIRFVGGPLALLAVALALHVDVPHVFFLLAAMPPAFHLIVLARVYDVRPALTRLLVVGATVPAVIAVAAAAAIMR
jgi:predicted permease